MEKSKKRNGLVRRALRYALYGFVAAVVLFLFSSEFLTDHLYMYFSGSTYMSDAFEKYRMDLQKYVNQKHVDATDFLAIQEWENDKPFAHFSVVREDLKENKRYLLYDAAYNKDVILDYAYSETDSINWMHYRPVQFADGEALVFIDMGFNLKFYIIAYLACAFLAVLAWATVFSIGMRRELKSIRKLDQVVECFSVGKMDAEIAVKGSREIENLADGLERMRNEILERREQEETMRNAQEKLVLGMAHDLRNPLTGLMNYIEIARQGAMTEDGKEFSKRALRKVREISDLSEQLFDFFLTQTQKEVCLDEPGSARLILEDYLSEMAMQLSMDGFEVVADDLSWPEVNLQVNFTYMDRIFRNLDSNMKKYADKAHPVYFVSELTEKAYILYIRNVPHNIPEKTVTGTKIGVDNIIGMMRQMHGHCEVTQQEDFYESKFTFPLVPQELQY